MVVVVAILFAWINKGAMLVFLLATLLFLVIPPVMRVIFLWVAFCNNSKTLCNANQHEGIDKESRQRLSCIMWISYIINVLFVLWVSSFISGDSKLKKDLNKENPMNEDLVKTVLRAIVIIALDTYTLTVVKSWEN